LCPSLFQSSFLSPHEAASPRGVDLSPVHLVLSDQISQQFVNPHLVCATDDCDEFLCLTTHDTLIKIDTADWHEGGAQNGRGSIKLAIEGGAPTRTPHER